MLPDKQSNVMVSHFSIGLTALYPLNRGGPVFDPHAPLENLDVKGLELQRPSSSETDNTSTRLTCQAGQGKAFGWEIPILDLRC